jgi:hypothetical protein
MGQPSLDILRSTAPPPEPPPGDEPPDDADADAKGRGETPEKAAASPAKRRKRNAPTGKTTSRNYYVTDDVHDRLLLYARERKMTLSAAANHVLHLGLPKYEVKRVS